MPFLSVIVPAFENPELLQKCLASIRNSDFVDYEILIADDGSLNGRGIAEVVARHQARLVRLETNSGPAAARNAAARQAAGDVLLFLDADVTVHPDTLSRMADAFRCDPTLDALVGSYDLRPEVSRPVAAFRNLLHAHVHHRSAGAATTFWAGCGGVRRLLFLEFGGFDTSYAQPSVEDVELGIRLHNAGRRLNLDPSIQVTHHKEWTLASMIHSDVICRARPWTELMFRHGLPHTLNFRWQDRASVASSSLLPLLVLLACLHGGVWWAVPAAALASTVLLQLPLFRFFARERGAGFALYACPLLFVHHLSSTAGLVLGVVRYECNRDRWAPWVFGLLAVLVFGLIQLGGGAYTAEFDGHPDEAAHFMTGLMIHDYLLHWPPPPPLSWAEQYYIHYPKVSFGHWPPVFHMLEAAWWLVFPPGRFSAVLFIGLLSLAAATAFYRIARAIVPRSAALAATCLLLATPVFQESTAQVMAEQLSLLLGLLFLGASVRLLRDDSLSTGLEVGLWGSLSLLVKGTAACLIPVPFLALLLAGRWRSWKSLTAASRSVALMLAATAIWYSLQNRFFSSVMGWGGMRGTLPWKIDLLPTLTGAGILALAALGLLTLLRYRQPVAVVSAAMVLSCACASFFLRAMNEPRHYVLALPGILLLALVALRRVWEIRSRTTSAIAAGLAAATGLFFFPWTFYRQHPAGYGQLAGQISRPSRILASGTPGWEIEGSSIVMVSLLENRPSSLVARASKLLMRPVGNSAGGRVAPDTPDAVEVLLDQYAIETVVLGPPPSNRPENPHHVLLRQTVSASPAWRECAGAGGIRVFRRILPPRSPRRPLEVDVRRKLHRFLAEN